MSEPERKAKTTWPPDLSKMSELKRFKYERRYKTRLALKSTRPVWNKWITIVQWASIGGEFLVWAI